jgi:SdrD B-like domain
MRVISGKFSVRRLAVVAMATPAVALGLITATLPATADESSAERTVSGSIWWDLNADGQQHADEPGLPIANVVLMRVDPEGAVFVAGAPTDSTGRYQFPVEKGARYYVSVVVKDRGYAVTTPNAGDDATDSDLAAVSVEDNSVVIGTSAEFVIGSSDIHIDGGYYLEPA